MDWILCKSNVAGEDEKIFWELDAKIGNSKISSTAYCSIFGFSRRSSRHIFQTFKRGKNINQISWTESAFLKNESGFKISMPQLLMYAICQMLFQMIIFYVTLVILIILLDGLIPRLREHSRIMEPSDSFAADEVRPIPHNLPPMQIEQQTPFSPIPPTSVAPPSTTEQWVLDVNITGHLKVDCKMRHAN